MEYAAFSWDGVLEEDLSDRLGRVCGGASGESNRLDEKDSSADALVQNREAGVSYDAVWNGRRGRGSVRAVQADCSFLQAEDMQFMREGRQ